ncbi:helix-turn-helix transcriptional regulator [Paenibacillus sp. y28]|uniref:helix-turn-helix transcriptional regulator n=1 Tax=Paenibacillus sp. y28 TaxID=3129110 RepID=UPI0030191BDE
MPRSEVLMCGYSFHNDKYYTGYKNGITSYLFRLQTEGRAQATVYNEWTPLEAGDLLLYRPGDYYELRIGEEHDAAENGGDIQSGDYFLFAEGGWLDRWWASSPKPQLARIDPDDRLIGLWRQMILEKRRAQEENTELTGYLLHAFCLTVDRALRVPEASRGQGKAFLGLRMKNYIQEHAGRPFKIEDVAGHVGLSVSRAVHLFKACFGVTIMQHALEIRLAAAVERMKYSTMTLEQIAETCGFGTYSYFHRVFRHKYSLSPAAFRKEANPYFQRRK